jgi:CheY-like chemotaxis protein
MLNDEPGDPCCRPEGEALMAAGDGRYKPILLVEDNGDIRTAIKVLLELEGYTVVTAVNGEEALQLLHAGLAAGLILLDLAMPIKDGFAFRTEQVQEPTLACIPVVVYSGASNVEDKAASLGVIGYFHKPVEIDQLLDLVQRHCLREQAMHAGQ